MKKSLIYQFLFCFSLCLCVQLSNAQETEPFKKYSLQTFSVGYGYNSQSTFYFDHLFIRDKKVQLGYQVGIGKRFFDYPKSYPDKYVFNYGSKDGIAIPITGYLLFGRARQGHHFGMGIQMTTLLIDQSYQYLQTNYTISTDPIPTQIIDYKDNGTRYEMSLPLFYRYQSPNGGFFFQFKLQLVIPRSYNQYYTDGSFINSDYYYSKAYTNNPFKYIEMQIGWTLKKK
jgi:hypothetical protein